jgi:serine protease Do
MPVETAMRIPSILMFTLAFLGSPAYARVMETGDAAAVRHASPSVVNIAEWKVNAPTEPGQSPRRIKVYASGFIIDPSGIIATNKHVVDGALDMHVILNNGDRLRAHLLVAAAMLDLALVKVDVGHPLPALKWGNSDALQVGDPVLTMGNQFGLGLAAAAGIVSAPNRNLYDSPFSSYIQTDATINHGNSGGPLIDRNGNVIGIDTALYNPEANGGFIGVGFAIPSNLAEFVVEFLLNPNHPKPGWIGVTVQDINDTLSQALRVPRDAGALISSVDALGPAYTASLTAGDVLETVNGMQQTDSRDFMRSIVKLPVGTKVHVTGWREGRVLDATVSVAAWPNYMPAEGVMRAMAAQKMIEQAPDPGMRLAPITEQARKQYGLGSNVTGALVSAVEPDCEASDLGIVPGDVITKVQGRPVTSPSDVRQAIETAHHEQRPYLAMLLREKRGEHWVSLSITSAGS